MQGAREQHQKMQAALGALEEEVKKKNEEVEELRDRLLVLEASTSGSQTIQAPDGGDVFKVRDAAPSTAQTVSRRRRSCPRKSVERHTQLIKACWQSVSVATMTVVNTDEHGALETAFAELKQSHLRLQQEHMRQMEEQVASGASRCCMRRHTADITRSLSAP